MYLFRFSSCNYYCINFDCASSNDSSDKQKKEKGQLYTKTYTEGDSDETLHSN